MKKPGVAEIRKALLAVDKVFTRCGLALPEGGFVVHPDALADKVAALISDRPHDITATDEATAEVVPQDNRDAAWSKLQTEHTEALETIERFKVTLRAEVEGKKGPPKAGKQLKGTIQAAIRSAVKDAKAASGGVSYHARGARAGETKTWMRIGAHTFTTSADVDPGKLPAQHRATMAKKRATEAAAEAKRLEDEAAEANEESGE